MHTCSSIFYFIFDPSGKYIYLLLFLLGPIVIIVIVIIIMNKGNLLLITFLIIYAHAINRFKKLDSVDGLTEDLVKSPVIKATFNRVPGEII